MQYFNKNIVVCRKKILVNRSVDNQCRSLLQPALLKTWVSLRFAAHQTSRIPRGCMRLLDILQLGGPRLPDSHTSARKLHKQQDQVILQTMNVATFYNLHFQKLGFPRGDCCPQTLRILGSCALGPSAPWRAAPHKPSGPWVLRPQTSALKSCTHKPQFFILQNSSLGAAPPSR